MQDANGAASPLYPIAEFGRGAQLAHAHFPIDEDGQVRGLHLEEGGFPAFALALFGRARASAASRDRRVADALARADDAHRDATVRSGEWRTSDYVLLPRLRTAPQRLSFGALLRGEIDAPASAAGW